MQIYRHFQTIYYKTVGKSLQPMLRTKAVLISILLPLMSTCSVLLTHYVIKIEKTKLERTFILQVVPYCFLDTLTYMMGAYWYLSCEVLSCIARMMAEHFHKVLTCFKCISIQYKIIFYRCVSLGFEAYWPCNNRCWL